MKFKMDVMSWFVETWLISLVLFTIVQEIAPNRYDELIQFGLLIILIALSIFFLSKKLPDQSNFKTGAILGCIVTLNLLIVAPNRFSFEDMFFTIFLLSTTFLLSGLFSKWLSHDKQKIWDQPWFILIIGALILVIVLGSVFFVLSAFSRLDGVSQQVSLTEFGNCESDLDCQESQTCYYHSCFLTQNKTTSDVISEDWLDYWYTSDDEPGTWDLINIEGKYYLKGMGHEWLRFQETLWDVSEIEFKAKLDQGGLHVNLIPSEEDLRYFLELENGRVEITQNEGEEYLVQDYVYFDYGEEVWNEYRIEFSTNISVYINDVLILSEAQNPYIEQTRFSFESLDDAVVYIDDLRIESVDYFQSYEQVVE